MTNHETHAAPSNTGEAMANLNHLLRASELPLQATGRGAFLASMKLLIIGVETEAGQRSGDAYYMLAGGSAVSCYNPAGQENDNSLPAKVLRGTRRLFLSSPARQEDDDRLSVRILRGTGELFLSSYNVAEFDSTVTAGTTASVSIGENGRVFHSFTNTHEEPLVALVASTLFPERDTDLNNRLGSQELPDDASLNPADYDL